MSEAELPIGPVTASRKETEIPTLEQCITSAVSLGMPPEEGEKFFYHHDQKDWMLGRAKIKRWRSALSLWRMNWIRWNSSPMQAANPQTGKLLPIEIFVRSQELEAVSKRMETLRKSYSCNQTWDEDDRQEMKKLRARKQELLGMLGRVI